MASSIIEELGLEPVINAAGTPSRLGGARLSKSVTDAMEAASQVFIPIEELQACASRQIASSTGGEAGLVASGACACLCLAAAACIARDDPVTMDQLPRPATARHIIAVHRSHRSPYDHALRAAGAVFAEFGYVTRSSGHQTHPWQLEGVLSDTTAAVFYAVDNDDLGALPLRAVIEIAHSRDVPVIVDAAGALPPVNNLRRFISDGADLVAFSGGKLIGGPSASGFLAGRSDLILSASAQHQDMYVPSQRWHGPFGESESTSFARKPQQGIGRMAKVGREEIVGLIAALRQFSQRDHKQEQHDWHEVLSVVESQLRKSVSNPSCTIETVGGPVPRLRLSFSGDAERALLVARALASGSPRIFFEESELDRGNLLVNPKSLSNSDGKVIAERLVEYCL